MKFLNLFHTVFLTLFALLNGMMLYLFLMKLPYGLEPLLISLRHWEKLSPRIGIMLSIALSLAILGIILIQRLTGMNKNRLLYIQGKPAHPAANAFLNNRKQPFESNALIAAHPKVKDSGFSPQTQIEAWETIHQKHHTTPVVINTRVHWLLLRDLYIVSILFLSAFLISWLLQPGTPFQLVAIYCFVFGAQSLFLYLTARRIGWKLVDNVLAVDLGLKEGDSLESQQDKRKGRSKKH